MIHTGFLILILKNDNMQDPLDFNCSFYEKRESSFFTLMFNYLEEFESSL